MTGYLTPYDTGKRAEPQPWGTISRDALAEASPIELALEEDRFGKVDFDDDEGASVVTIWVERNDRGFPVVHIQPLGHDVGIEVHRDQL